MEGNEKSSLLGKAMNVGERLVEVGDEAARLKTAASHAVEDAVIDAKRLARRSRYAAEDLMEDAAHFVKRDPLRSVALGVAVGLGIGALLLVGLGQGVLDVGVVGIFLHRLLQLPQRQGGIALAQVGNAEHIVGFGLLALPGRGTAAGSQQHHEQ